MAPKSFFWIWRNDGKKGLRFICLSNEPLLNGLRNHFPNIIINRNARKKSPICDQKVFNAMHRVYIIAPSITVILMRVWLWYCHCRTIAATAAIEAPANEIRNYHFPYNAMALPTIFSILSQNSISTASISIFN